ncbi:hypothetical protein [Streptomyces sp. 5-10]|uniref:hypothetical protein n=1 Tax=Streptomyces sp. 5-10 TaxID=878925 RepID=UPI00168BB493|nr:hypothetical protein [Streptomyces sp. 5-10]MBD3004762.1 hypothetical protein [Streptomyces sp. 5-10]
MNANSEWCTTTVTDWLAKNPIVRAAARQVCQQWKDSDPEFWLAKFLWDVLYGNGLPFGAWTRFSLQDGYFSCADFTKIMNTLTEEET